MSDRLLLNCKKRETSNRNLTRTRSSSSVAAGLTRDSVTRCLRLVTLAAYGHTMAVEATKTANELLHTSKLTSLRAGEMTEFAEMVTQHTKNRAKAVSENNFNLAQVYSLASSHPISLYGFLQVVAPANHEYFDKVSPDNTPESTSYGPSSSDAWDRFSWPSVKRIKSITELHESHANMMSATDRKMREKRVVPVLSPSPLLTKEDAENIQKTVSPKVSQHSGIQLHKYSIRATRSGSSSMSFSSQ